MIYELEDFEEKEYLHIEKRKEQVRKLWNKYQKEREKFDNKIKEKYSIDYIVEYFRNYNDKNHRMCVMSDK